jgi:hypothetical protein
MNDACVLLTFPQSRFATRTNFRSSRLGMLQQGEIQLATRDYQTTR